MDLRHLRTFVTVAEQGTVTKAALLLRIAQPALSRQISELERDLGLQLFDRIGRRLALTAEGEQLLGDCRRLLGSAGALSERALLLRRGDVGVLKVAASPIQIETALSGFLARYAERYPKVQVKLVESVGLETLAMVERGEIHLAISLLDALQAEDRHLDTYPVPPLEIVAACDASFRLEHGGSIDIAALAALPLLLQDSSFTLRKTFDAVCRLARLKLNVLIESRAPHTLLALAEAGLGVAICPSALQTHRYKLRVVRVTHKGKPLTYPRAVVWDKRRILPLYAKDFCSMLAAHMRERAPALKAPAGKRLKPRPRAAGHGRG